MNTNVAHDYPRPQLVRSGALVLSGPWGFAVDEHEVGESERWFDATTPFTRTIHVPYPPEAPASGIGEDVAGHLWYRRELDVVLPAGHRGLLHFEGVDYAATVWLNGAHVGEHVGSQSRFTFDVTGALRSGRNVLVVRAEDRVDDLEQPRGKQDWQPDPHVIWYRRTSGIWRTVWLEVVPATRIERLVLTPMQDLRSVQVECRIVGPIDARTHLDIDLTLRGQPLAGQRFRCTTGVVNGVVVLQHPDLDTEPENVLWAPEHPTLIDVHARLTRDDATVDEVTSYVGLRTVGTDDRHVLLNGRPYFLRLVLEQVYWPDTHLASPSFAALEREVVLIKELGFNGIRMHQTSADPQFLACCDRLGLVVWADAAATYRFSEVAFTRTLNELIALLRRDASHPCVIAWVPFNESWGLPRLATSEEQQHAVIAVHALLKALDPSRIALGNDGWQYVAGDVVGVHDYTQDPDLLAERYGDACAVRRTVADGHTGGRKITLPRGADGASRKPVVLSEFGGISVHDDDTAWAAYGDVVNPEDLAKRLADLVEHLGDTSGLAGYCYTQLTDTAQEQNGLLRADRTPKCAPDLIRAALLCRKSHAGYV